MITRRVLVTYIAPNVWQGTADLRFDPADPVAVTVVFHSDGHEVPWMIARDLLKAGLREHAGLGDVRLWPDGDRLMVALTSTDGSARLSFDASQVHRFLLATYRSVPRARESVDVDGLLDALLGGAA